MLPSALLFISAARTQAAGLVQALVNGVALGIGPGRSDVDAQLNDVSTAYDPFDHERGADGPAGAGRAVLRRRELRQLVADLHHVQERHNKRRPKRRDVALPQRDQRFRPIGTSGTQYYLQPHEFQDARQMQGATGSSRRDNA